MTETNKFAARALAHVLLLVYFLDAVIRANSIASTGNGTLVAKLVFVAVCIFVMDVLPTIRRNHNG